MTDIQPLLEQILASQPKVAILGCGSVLRCDDAAGTEIALRLADLSGRARAFAGYVAPENLTGEIKNFAPNLILVIDAIDLGIETGEVRLIEQADITGVSFSTHMLPLKIIVDYLHQETGAEIALLGIQSGNLEFMDEMSDGVTRTIDEITEMLRSMLTGDFGYNALRS